MGFRNSTGGGITQLTGEVTAGPGEGSQVATLAPVITAGSVGGASAVPEITYNDAGQITGIASTAPNDATKIPLSTVTAAGDLIVGTGAGAVSRLGIGANGDVLTVASGALSYAAPGASSLPSYTAELGGVSIPGTDVATTLATITLPVGTYLLNASLGVYSTAATTSLYSIAMQGVVGTAVGTYAPATGGQFAQASLRSGAAADETIMLSGTQIITITTAGTFIISALSDGAVESNSPQSTATLVKIG